MPYVANDGSIVQSPPFTKRVSLFFLSFWTFITFFFKTLFGENVNKSGSKYSRDYRGGGGGGGGPSGGSGPRGGPRPPERRVGRIGRMSDVCSPPMGGGG